MKPAIAVEPSRWDGCRRARTTGSCSLRRPSRRRRRSRCSPSRPLTWPFHDWMFGRAQNPLARHRGRPEPDGRLAVDRVEHPADTRSPRRRSTRRRCSPRRSHRPRPPSTRRSRSAATRCGHLHGVLLPVESLDDRSAAADLETHVGGADASPVRRARRRAPVRPPSSRRSGRPIRQAVSVTGGSVVVVVVRRGRRGGGGRGRGGGGRGRGGAGGRRQSSWSSWSAAGWSWSWWSEAGVGVALGAGAVVVGRAVAVRRRRIAARAARCRQRRRRETQGQEAPHRFRRA